MKLLGLLEIVMSLIMATSTAPSNPGNTSHYVTDVVDGDTITVGNDKDVRLIGVDTPEVYGNVNPEEFDAENTTCLDNYADKASEYVKESVEGREVGLKKDRLVDNRGSYGRLLRYVEYADGQVLNEELVRKGYARVYTEAEFSRMDQYLDLERGARRSDTGLWKC